MNTPQIERQVYTVHEIHKLLGIGINQAYDLVKDAPFPVLRVRNKIRIPKEPFHQWMLKSNN